MAPTTAPTVADATLLLRAVAPSVIESSPGSFDGLAGLLGQPRETPLDAGALVLVWSVMPLILGNAFASDAAREQVAKRWLGSALSVERLLEQVATTHPHGSSLIDCDPVSETVWAPARLLWWAPNCPGRTHESRWLLTPDFPVPIRQIKLVGLQPGVRRFPVGDLREPLVARTLADLRLAAGPWASTWSTAGQTIGDILAIGGFDGLAAAALLLCRGTSPLDGWLEARSGLGLAPQPGWAGAVMSLCGTPDPELQRIPQVQFAWMTADFEGAATMRLSARE